MTLRIVERVPTPDEYAALRRAVGWHELPQGLAAAGFPNSLYSVCAEDGGRIVACARIVGDGGIYFYLQDVIVLPEYQRTGIGAAMMDALIGYLRRHALPGAFIGLMAARNASGFYERYGFQARPEGSPGMFRVWTEQDFVEGTAT